MTAALRIVRIGPVAAEILARDGDAEVAAAFERSATIMTPHGFITLAGEPLGDGPLNVLLSGNPGPLDWLRLGITREAKGKIVHGRLYIGDTFALTVTGGSIWQPPAWPTATRGAIGRSLAAVRSLETGYWPSEGLSRLVIAGRPDVSDRSARAAQPIIADLVRMLPAAIATEVASLTLQRSATLLVGLGPGLTPSGDDFLGGLFLGLSALGRTRLRDALWDAILPEIDLLTTGFSGAHLAAAADGMASERVHLALNAMIAHDASSLPAHIAAVHAIGHSSGCDTLAGIVTSLDASLAAAIVP
jgi:Protein of unknown function (DUF2877)